MFSFRINTALTSDTEEAGIEKDWERTVFWPSTGVSANTEFGNIQLQTTQRNQSIKIDITRIFSFFIGCRYRFLTNDF